MLCDVCGSAPQAGFKAVKHGKMSLTICSRCNELSKIEVIALMVPHIKRPKPDPRGQILEGQMRLFGDKEDG
jgi:ribosome-binding protein aMBF1 (putative translation factor)